mgnify:FL=1
MNCYATLDDFKLLLGISATTYDTLFVQILEATSREIEGPQIANRWFWTYSGDRYYDGIPSGLSRMVIDDALAITAIVADTEQDETYDGEEWVEGTDYRTGPYNEPVVQWIDNLDQADYRFQAGKRLYKITGTWGYGDGRGNAWTTTSVTGTVATAAGTTLTLSVSGGVTAGQTLLIESEQLYVTAVSGTSATVTRGVNGTTAAAHSAKAISVAAYPEIVTRACLFLSAEAWKGMRSAGLSEMQIGQWREKYKATGVCGRHRICTPVKRYDGPFRSVVD